MVNKKHSLKPEKEPDLLIKIRKAIEEGNYINVAHAVERAFQRKITRKEYEYVLKTGWHEKRKDDFKEEYNSWNYAIRGKTLDDRELRISVSFEENNLLIITVIDLEVS